MDRRRRNLRLELNKAFYRALDMPTVGPNSYGQLFEEAQNVCLLKLPNNPSVHYHGIDRVKSVFINAASKVYFGTLKGQITFAFYNSFYEEAEKPISQAQSSIVSFYYARLRIAGKKHEVSSSFSEAFKHGVTSIGSIETIHFSGRRNILDVPNLTALAAPLYFQEKTTLPENTVFLGHVDDHTIIKSIKDMGISLASRDEVLDRVLAERYGVKQKPPELGR